MKKMIILISLIAVMFILAGCGETSDEPLSKAEKLSQVKASKGLEARSNFAGQAIANPRDCSLTGCPDGWPGDGICDASCNNEACNYDDGDCETDRTVGGRDTELCASGCQSGWSPDGYCDAACNNAACNNDGGDCQEATEVCSCPARWLNDGICDAGLYNCDADICQNDGGDCSATRGDPSCATGCPASWPGDGWCDATCNNAACEFDDGDCATPYKVLLEEYKKLPANKVLTAEVVENQFQNGLKYGFMAASDTARAIHLKINVDTSSVEKTVNSVYFGLVNQGVAMEPQAARIASFLYWEGNQMSGLLNLDLSKDAALKTKLADINFKNDFDDLNSEFVAKKWGGKDNQFFSDGSSGGTPSGEMPGPSTAGNGAAGSQAGASKFGLGCANAAPSYGGAPIGGPSTGGASASDNSQSGGNPWVMPSSQGSFDKAGQAGKSGKIPCDAFNFDAMDGGGKAGKQVAGATYGGGTGYKDNKGNNVNIDVSRTYAVHKNKDGSFSTIVTTEVTKTVTSGSDGENVLSTATSTTETETGGNTIPEGKSKSQSDSDGNADQVETKVTDSDGEEHKVTLDNDDALVDPNAESSGSKSAKQKCADQAKSCDMPGIASMGKSGTEKGAPGSCNALGMLGQPGGPGGFNSIACKKEISAAGVSILPGGYVVTIDGKSQFVYVDPKTTTPSDFQTGGAFAITSIDSSAEKAAGQAGGNYE
jgi:hypothetical protein